MSWPELGDVVVITSDLGTRAYEVTAVESIRPHSKAPSLLHVTFETKVVPLPNDWDDADRALYSESLENLGHDQAVAMVEALR